MNYSIPKLTKKHFILIYGLIWVLLILINWYTSQFYVENYRGGNLRELVILILSPWFIIVSISVFIERRHVLIALCLSTVIYIIAFIISVYLSIILRYFLGDALLTHLDFIVYNRKSFSMTVSLLNATSISITHYLLYKIESTIIKYRAKKKGMISTLSDTQVKE